MPFMTVACAAEEDSLLRPPVDSIEAADTWGSKLEEATALCESLDGVTSYKGPLSQASERTDGSWSVHRCIERVLELRGCDEEVCKGSRLQLCALASTAYLPGELRLRAMELAQQGELLQLVTLVEGSLQEEARRRIAMKALRDI